MHNLLFTQGKDLLFILVILIIITFFHFRYVAYCLIIFLCFSFYFFRNPSRICPQAMKDDSLIVSPADGKVINIERSKDPSLEGYHQKISIFLSPFDVHVNWIPTTGIITSMQYHSGTFSLAFLPKSSLYNERNDIIIKRFDGRTAKIRQIAGTIARKICCWVKEGDCATVGDKYGMIRFGSRVELFLPKSVQLYIGIGQYVYGGQTIVGKWELTSHTA